MNDKNVQSVLDSRALVDKSTGAATTVAPEPLVGALWTDRVRDYIQLTKPEITFLVTISALAGFVLGSPGSIDGWKLCWALVGIPLVSAGGAVLNHYYERALDARMRRTAARPLPAGRIEPERALTFGLVLAGAGLGILCPLTNPLTGVLAAVTVALYLFVYTPLKRITPYNTLVGTVPGAMPALGGWTAATGDFGAGGWAVFAILLFWQMPHFMSLAWMYRRDYERAGYAMWTINDVGGKRTVRLTMAFSVLMAVTSLLPWALELSGWIYAAGAAVLSTWFLVLADKFRRERTVARARDVLRGSIWYIPALLLLIVADRLLGI